VGQRDIAKLIHGVRGPEAVRAATARICDQRRQHRGQGLVLAMDDGVVVLTCHHVIAGIPPGGVWVQLPDGRGGRRTAVLATVDPSRSRPERDAVVLHINVDAPPPRPLLHALDPVVYGGDLPKRAIGYTHMSPRTLSAWVGDVTDLDLSVQRPPAPPQRYRIPSAFRLTEPTDVRQGVSGAVVAYEGGVLGLAHFAREAGRAHERELNLVPLSTWARGWEELDSLIEPLIDERLRNAAMARRVKDVKVGISNFSPGDAVDLPIAGYRENVYVERPQLEAARRALETGGLLIIGRPKSGKTRLAWELIRAFSDAVLVMPHAPVPPLGGFETAGLSGRQIILLCDDLHQVAEQAKPLLWIERFRRAAGAVFLIATVRDSLEWDRVCDEQTDLLEAISDDQRIFISRGSDGGEDLPFTLGKHLARQLGLSGEEFGHRFDGTPGSLTLDLDAMKRRYERLRREQLGGVSGSRLLDSLKLLHNAGQSDLAAELAQTVAERIRGNESMAAEVWEGLCRRTEQEGFGSFTARGEFQTYHPYLEQCVTYVPVPAELDTLAALFRERGELARLAQLDVARGKATAVLQTCIQFLTALLELLDEDSRPTLELWLKESIRLRPHLLALENLLANLPGTDNIEMAMQLRSAGADVYEETLILREATNLRESIWTGDISLRGKYSVTPWGGCGRRGPGFARCVRRGAW
jgi:hypothetical protein